MNQFTLPSNYPTKVHHDSPPPPKEKDIKKATKDSFLYPIKLSYNILTQGLEFAIFNFYKNVWSKKETMEYLKLLGVGTRISTYAINYANTKTTEYNDSESLFETFVYPSMWKSNINLEDFLETPMHHLFEGIVKTIIEVQMIFLNITANGTLMEDIATLYWLMLIN